MLGIIYINPGCLFLPSPPPPSPPTPSHPSSPSLFHLLPPRWFTFQTSIYPPLTNCVNMLHHSLVSSLPPPHFICSPSPLASSSSGKPPLPFPPPPPPPAPAPAPGLAAELWDGVSKWGMASASGGCGCAPQDPGCVRRPRMCGWIMLVPHCSALLPPADRNMTGWLVYDRRVYVCVCVCGCTSAGLTTASVQIQQPFPGPI